MEIIKIKSIWLVLLTILPLNIYAKCDPTVPEHYPGNIPPDFYGNSYSDKFKCALHGENDDYREMHEELAKLIPEDHRNRWYLRIGYHAGTQSISKFKNQAETGVTANLSIATEKDTSSSNGANVAIGVYYNEFVSEFQWMSLEKQEFSSYINNSSTDMNFKAISKGEAYLYNINYNIEKIKDFKIYVAGTLGLTRNDTELSVNGYKSSGSGKFNVSYGFGAGAYYNIYKNFYIDLSAKYLCLGAMHFESSDTNGAIIFKANRDWYGLNASIIWII